MPIQQQAARIIRMLLRDSQDPDIRSLAEDFLAFVDEPAEEVPRTFYTSAQGAPQGPLPTAGPVYRKNFSLQRGNAPFGHVWAKSTAGARLNLVPHPREQRVLARIRELRDEGKTYAHIVDALNTELPAMAPRDAPKWTISTVRQRVSQVRDAASQPTPGTSDAAR